MIVVEVRACIVESSKVMADLFLTPYVRSTWKMLHHRLGENFKMCVFGAGAHTRWLLEVTADLPTLPIECILDDKSTETSIAGIPVRKPGDVDTDAIDLILLSSDRWEDELADRAQSLWRCQIEGNQIEVVRLYEGLPRGPYDKSDDRVQALQRISTMKVNRPTRSGQVVIISDRPGSREAKMGYALKHAGCQPILFHRKALPFDADLYFDKIHCYNHEWEALHKACDFSPMAYHIMVNSDYRLAELFVRHRPGVVVIDSYDCIAGMYTDAFMAAHPDFSAQIEIERYCLEQADGICCRSRETDWLEQQMGYSYRNQLHFPDGCWNRATATTSFDDGEIHTVYAGHMDQMSGDRQTFTAHGSKLWLARTLADQQIHFHLYPWSTATGKEFESTFCEYRELERSTRYFHLHRPLPPDHLIDELSQYNLAMFVYNEFVEPGAIVQNFTSDKLSVCASNKVFDFIDALLPIVHIPAKGSFINELMEQHQIRVDVQKDSPTEWGKQLSQLDFESYRARIIQARNDYDIRRHVHKLTDYYQVLRDQETITIAKQVENKEEYSHAGRRSENRTTLV